MSPNTRQEIRGTAAGVFAALVVSAAVAVAGMLATQEVYGSRIARAEQDIVGNRTALESLRDSVDHKLAALSEAITRTGSDVSWIRGKLEGKTP